MGAGTKILAGCGCLAIATAVAVLAALGLGLFWIKDQAVDMASSLEGLTSRTDEIEEWERQANAHPYVPPEDGVIPEARLLAFLGVRRDVHEVYETHKAELEALRHKAEGDQRLSPGELLDAGSRAVRMFSDLRLAQVRALADNAMSEEEYYALQTAVYFAAGAAKTQEGTGKMPAEAMTEASRQIQEAIRVAMRAARLEGLPGVDRVSESDVKKLEEGVAKMGEGGAQALAVAPANVALFHKHEEEIQKYAMHGLALLGL